MSWLFPFYLLGAVAIIGPILMHLRRRPPQDRVEFSSLMFLDAQVPMPVSKRRLEHWLLLLLRCLALILLALMFARPLWRSEDAVVAGQGQATLILLDRSASMQRGDLWAQAKSEAAARIAATSPVDRISLATFDREVRPLWTFTEDLSSASTRIATAKQRLDQTKPGWAATDLGRALVDAVSLFGSEPGMTGLKKRIFIISDFQEGSRLDALRSQVWPETIAVTVVRVSALDSDNLSLSLAATDMESPEAAVTAPAAAAGTPAAGLSDKAGARSTLRLRLANARDSKVADVSVAWEKGGGEPLTAYIPPGATRILAAPPIRDKSLARVLRLTGDAWDFDNRVFMAPPQPKIVRIVFVGDETARDEAASPLFYLSRALQSTPTLLPELKVIPPSATSIPTGTDIVFVSGAVLKEAQASLLRGFMEAGGMVVSVVDESTTPSTLSSLSGIPAASLSLSKAAPSQDYLMLAEVDSAHPLLRPFADERLRDFTKLRFWHHRRLEPAAEAAKQLRVIARFDNRDPAILTASPGKGTLVLLTSGWHPADSQLALSTKFVPLLYGWLEAAGFRNEQASSLLVGDVLPVEADTTAIMTPDGQTLSPIPGQAIRAEIIGLYTLQSKTSQQIAVNLAPEETRVIPMDPEKLRELGVRLEADESAAASSRTEDREHLATAEQEGRQRAWLWLLAAILCILGMETWLAGRIRHSSPQPTYS